jgi:hypothetical protein
VDDGKPLVFSRPAPCRWTCARCGWLSPSFASYEALRVAIEDVPHPWRGDVHVECSYDDTTRGVDYTGDEWSGNVPFLPRETVYGLQTGPFEFLPPGGVQPYEGRSLSVEPSVTMPVGVVDVDSMRSRPNVERAARRAAERARTYPAWLKAYELRREAESAPVVPVVSWWRRRLRALGDWLKNL